MSKHSSSVSDSRIHALRKLSSEEKRRLVAESIAAGKARTELSRPAAPTTVASSDGGGVRAEEPQEVRLILLGSLETEALKVSVEVQGRGPQCWLEVESNWRVLPALLGLLRAGKRVNGIGKLGAQEQGVWSCSLREVSSWLDSPNRQSVSRESGNGEVNLEGYWLSEAELQAWGKELMESQGWTQNDQVWVVPVELDAKTTLAALGLVLNGVELMWSTEPVEPERHEIRSSRVIEPGMGFSLLFFSDDETAPDGEDKYRLLTEAATFADKHGFEAVWMPERHFHSFGGIYPNPAVLAASLARTTQRIRLRAGSVVVPLHSPVEVAENWAMVDNLSGGRVDLSFAGGWNPDDFVLSPDTFEKRREVLLERMDVVRRLWRGESVQLPNGKGELVEVRIYPRPLQSELNTWFTAATNPASFEAGGTHGANILTMLYSSTMKELEERIRRYRICRESYSDGSSGTVTLMLHSFVHQDGDWAREVIRKPFLGYIRKSVQSQRKGYDRGTMSDEDWNSAAEFAFERYSRTAALFGTPDECAQLVRDAQSAGVSEIACQLDFGVATESVLGSLSHLDQLRDRFSAKKSFGGVVAKATKSIKTCLASEQFLTGQGAAPEWKKSLGPIHQTSIEFPSLMKRKTDLLRTPGDGNDSAARDESRMVGEVAVVALSGRYPGAGDVETFWANLERGNSSIGPVPPDRWGDSQAGPAADFGAFIDGHDAFDHRLFGISAVEAGLMDPHQRVFLETVWELLESGGYCPQGPRKERVGLFAAMYSPDFHEVLATKGADIDAVGLLGRLNVMVANRTSYLFDLHGPSEVIDAACASSIVAIQRAVQSLQSGACEMAIAGGVSLLLSQGSFAWLDQVEMLSPTGRCRPFREAADGLVRGEGAGAVLLKPLAAARRDGDAVLGVIRGVAVNHNGASSTSPTTPSTNAQVAVMEAAYRSAGVDPASIDYVEAHGSGSETGDYAEVAAFRKVFAGTASRNSKGRCGIGTVKPNIGSLDAASGMASLTKVLMGMEHGRMAATVGEDGVHPDLPFKADELELIESSEPWQTRGKRRRAAVHSFGLGGTNAHLIIEEAPPRPASVPTSRGARLWVFSALDESALKRSLRKFLSWWPDDRDAAFWDDVCFTLRAGRAELAERLAVVAESPDEARRALIDWVERSTVGDSIWHGRVDRRGETWAGAMKLDDAAHCAQVAAAWVSGKSIPWDAEKTDRLIRQRLSLPTYAFERIRFPVAACGRKRQGAHSLLGTVVPSMESGCVFEISLTGEDPLVAQHRVHGMPMVPASLWLITAQAAGERLLPVDELTLEDVHWPNPQFLNSEESCFRLTVKVEKEVPLIEVAESDGAVCMAARFSFMERLFEPVHGSDLLDSVQGRCSRILGSESIYEGFRIRGIDYGPAFARLVSVRFNETEAIGELGVPPALDPLRPRDREGEWPAVLDSALQVASVFVPEGDAKSAWFPFGIERFQLNHLDRWPTKIVAQLRSGRQESEVRFLDGVLLDELDEVIGRWEGLCIKRGPDLGPDPEAVSSRNSNGHSNGHHITVSEGPAVGLQQVDEDVLLLLAEGKLTIQEAEQRLFAGGQRKNALEQQGNDSLERSLSAFATDWIRDYPGTEHQFVLACEGEGEWLVAEGAARAIAGDEGREVFRVCCHTETWKRLVAGEQEPAMAMITRQVTFEPESNLAMRQRLGGVWFHRYNQHHLIGRFEGHSVAEIYRSGIVKTSDGFERALFPWAIPMDVGVALYKLVVAERCVETLEIGMAFGLSSVFMAQGLKDVSGRLHVTVDPCQSREFQGIGVANVERSGLGDLLELIEKPDYEALPGLLAEERQFDLIFIDGLHMFDYVLLDFFYCDQLLRDGGLMVFDDVSAPGVGRVVDYVRANRAYTYLPESNERLAIFRKVRADGRSLEDPNYHREF